jgi:N-acylneuraminate cytidylyltransferase
VKTVAFIPARAGSKRIPHKNLAMVGDRTLLQRAIDAAEQGGCERNIYVSTDDEDIALAAMSWGRAVRIHDRPAELATDHAQIESALAHWWRRCDDKPDVVVLLQATSPFRTAEHVRQAIALLVSTGADSVVGVTAGHEGHFAGRLKPREEYPSCGGDQCCSPVEWFEWQPFRNPIETRPRTQDLRPMGHENGSLYAFTRQHWEATGNRLGGRMVALPMTWIEGLDVDTPEDLAAARAIAEGMGL